MCDCRLRARSIEEIYDTALDAILKAMHADRAAVLLFDADAVIRFRAWRGLSDAYRAAVEGHSPWRPDQADAAPVRWVIETKALLCVEEVAEIDHRGRVVWRQKKEGTVTRPLPIS